MEPLAESTDTYSAASPTYSAPQGLLQARACSISLEATSPYKPTCKTRHAGKGRPRELNLHYAFCITWHSGRLTPARPTPHNDRSPRIKRKLGNCWASVARQACGARNPGHTLTSRRPHPAHAALQAVRALQHALAMQPRTEPAPALAVQGMARAAAQVTERLVANPSAGAQETGQCRVGVTHRVRTCSWAGCPRTQGRPRCAASDAVANGTASRGHTPAQHSGHNWDDMCSSTYAISHDKSTAADLKGIATITCYTPAHVYRKIALQRFSRHPYTQSITALSWSLINALPAVRLPLNDSAAQSAHLPMGYACTVGRACERVRRPAIGALPACATQNTPAAQPPPGPQPPARRGCRCARAQTQRPAPRPPAQHVDSINAPVLAPCPSLVFYCLPFDCVCMFAWQGHQLSGFKKPCSLMCPQAVAVP